ncbi:MAG TPA: alpha-amylase family glycosyl hydrolase [Acidothermaceae bacterium]|nr:alpha-amylase family glycosyl hydrolase [Acidothermaceae bacterium]
MRETAAATQRWWRDAVIYEVYVRSFADADGNGVGDLRGITARLPQLAELGIDAVWLTPFYRSPMADGGYDVADYEDVDPTLGTLEDFDVLLASAHDLALKVIVDLVPNHTSDHHPWFQAALAAGRGSPERARYIFRDGRGPGGNEPPADWHANFGGSAWTQVADGQWYLHMFAPEQPDLDWSNPVVGEAFESVLRFWLDRGVDGFRIDVAHGMAKKLTEPFPDLGAKSVDKQLRYEVVDHPLWDRDEVHDIFRVWRRILDEYSPPRIGVAEAWVMPGRRARYVRPDELHQAFNFDFLQAPWDCAALVDVIEASLREAGGVGATATWVLSNHDVVRHLSRYSLPASTDLRKWLLSDGTEPAPDLRAGLRRARAAALLMLALPGSAYLYQGEELGLPEVADIAPIYLQDPTWERSDHQDKGRDGCRVPLPWEPSGPSFGFSSVTGWIPQPANWAELSWGAEDGDPTATLELYRSALALRRKFGTDDALTWLTKGPDTLSFARSNGLVCIVNFGAEAVAIPAGQLLLTSGELADGALLPTDTAAWVLTN